MKKQTLFLLFFCLFVVTANAQVNADAGAAGLQTAVKSIKSYFPVIRDLCYVIGGVVGLIGGIRIYNKWNAGDQDISKELVSFGGAMLFLVLVPSIVGSFFNVS